MRGSGYPALRAEHGRHINIIIAEIEPLYYLEKHFMGLKAPISLEEDDDSLYNGVASI